MAQRPEGHYRTILIGSPLEVEHVRRIEAAVPGRLRVLFEPDLLPEPRYVADHNGIPRSLDSGQLGYWTSLLSQAEIMFDFDWMSPELLPQNAPNLRWVQATSSGIGEFLVKTRLIESDIKFTTASGVHAVPLAEFVLTALLHFFRGVPHLQEWKAQRSWTRYTNRGVAGRTVLLIGLGAVGRQVARHCGSVGLEVWAIDRDLPESPPEGVSKLLPTSMLRSALPNVDALILCCPLTRETHHLIGTTELEALAPTAVLVNVGRGPVVDEKALIAALQRKQLAGAALDVFEIEPLPTANPLWGFPNVLISPHSASTVLTENEKIVDLFVDNLKRYLDGLPLRNEFDRARSF
jgi:glyoxylate/hydroxypyruvate reductase A